MSDKSLCDVIKKGTPAFALVVPLAVPVPAAFVLSCLTQQISHGVVPVQRVCKNFRGLH